MKDSKCPIIYLSPPNEASRTRNELHIMYMLVKMANGNSQTTQAIFKEFHKLMLE